MTVRDAINRGYNLVGTAMVAITGFAFFPEFFIEDELTHKLDESVLFLLALGSIAWYLIGKNKFSRTFVPILFTAAALIMKLLAFFIFENGDAADLADEFGALILFAITLAFLVWQYVSIKRIAAKEAAEIELVASSR
jgi:hypothetical protein